MVIYKVQLCNLCIDTVVERPQTNNSKQDIMRGLFPFLAFNWDLHV